MYYVKGKLYVIMANKNITVKFVWAVLYVNIKDGYLCKECHGKGICEHGKQRPFCYSCGGVMICTTFPYIGADTHTHTHKFVQSWVRGLGRAFGVQNTQKCQLSPNQQNEQKNTENI